MRVRPTRTLYLALWMLAQLIEPASLPWDRSGQVTRAFPSHDGRNGAPDTELRR